MPNSERTAFVKRHAPGLRGQAAMRALHDTLSAAPAAPTLEDASAVVARLLGWVLGGGRVSSARRTAEGTPRPPGEGDARSPAARLGVLLDVFEEQAAWRACVAAALAVLLERGAVTRILCRTSLPAEHAFFSELSDRLLRKVLPAAPEGRGAKQLLRTSLRRKKALAAFQALPSEGVLRLLALLARERPGLWSAAREALADAATLLAAQAAAIGASEQVRDRSPEVSPRSSPFLLLPATLANLVRAGEQGSGAERAAARAACAAELAGCRRVVRSVLLHLEQAGVSVNLVYRLELATLLLARLESFVELLAPEDEPAHGRCLLELVLTLAEDTRRESSVGALVGTNLRLLARKIIERTGETGEHYITRTGREQLKMLGSAAGGGVLTAGTTALKFLLGAAKLPLFVGGALASLNYAGSFLLMQALGFTLATKQPSMTAAALAAALGKEGARTLDDAVEMIARIVRSQLTAAVGNLGAVIPAAIALNLACLQLSGRTFLDAQAAQYVVRSLHPTEGGTLYYAAFTGVLLWMSSVAAGWLENWAVYRRLPEAIASSRTARLLLTRRGAAWLSRKVSHGISGLGGNTALGAMLGFTPMFGTFFGLPLDVRHVTLSTGALVLAACADPTLLGSPALSAAGVGILLIGTLNFGVSFALALAVALRARDVALSDGLRLLRGLLRRFVTAPHTFFVAVGGAKAPAPEPDALPPPG